ncbi:Kiwa anti-phage protein KwaB-like domain-containing protein [Methanococcus maripaludis]|uniref:DUF4868 domain-containing protein n=1 Tax=Methanococcus maripaludis TaxID=39152 RepID=A0A2L1CA63_METMI|nr:Kiwa anti-phage protein KwaB-like domain-containing protein [Methanococcus maripaludis]AVB76110.1 hypothetical protein MMJJ_06960 [Methanococcus maripaludis]
MEINVATILKMPDIYKMLKDENLNLGNITLNFVERTKKKELITHKIWRTEFNSNHAIEQELLKIAQLEVGIRCGDEYFYPKYSPMAKYDKKVIEVMSAEDIPHFEDIYDKTYGDPEFLNSNALKNIKKIWGYIVTIDIFDNKKEISKNLIFIKKHSPLKLLGKGTLNMVFNRNNGKFDKIEDSIFALEDKFDGMIYKGKEMASEDISEIMYVFNKNGIELFFDFHEGYKKEIDDKKDKLVEQKIIDKDNLEVLVSLSKRNKDLTKKFATVLNTKSYKTWDHNSISDTKSEFKLDEIEFDENDNLIINSKNYATVIKILDDDYLESKHSGNKYETHSKVRV